MNFELDHDLTAWADGSLSREDLITLHGRQATTLLALHERLLGAAQMPVPDPVAGWALLQEKMDAGTKVVSIRTRPRFRRALLAVAAALVIGGGAFAAIRGGAVDHPGLIPPPTAAPTAGDPSHQQAPGQTDGSAGATDGRSSGSSTSSPEPTAGSGDSTEGSTGSAGTGDSGSTDGSTGSTDGSGDTSGGSSGGDTQDPNGEHSGQGNGGQDNGQDGTHGHGGVTSTAHS